MTRTECTTLYCPRPGTVPGIFRMEEERDHQVTYCHECARTMHADGLFFPANEDDVADTPELSAEELAVVERFETAPPVCLSCDQAEDTIARVLALADELLAEARVTARLAKACAKNDDWARAAVADAKAWTTGDVAARIRDAIKGAA